MKYLSICSGIEAATCAWHPIGGEGRMKTIKTDIQRMALIREISSTPLPFRVDVRAGERTLDQNALSHVWYGQIAAQDKSFSVVSARRFCKLHFGVPSMRAHSAEFRQAWDSKIKARFTYSEKIELMDWWPVTSLMDKSQMRDYLTTMQAHFAEKGVRLEGLEPNYEQYPEVKRA